MKQETNSLKKNQNELMSTKHKKVTALNYIKCLLVLGSVVTGVFQFLLSFLKTSL